MKKARRFIGLLAALSIFLGVACGAKAAPNDPADTAPAGAPAFSDVREGDWFYEAVRYVCERGIMNGSSAETFAPYEKTTRAMVVTMLYRLDGEPAASGGCPFGDVASGKYYWSAVVWAAENRIVSGLSSDRFGPDEAVTREQLAAILYRYAGYRGFGTWNSAELDKFADGGQVAAYALTAMKWAAAEGLLTGVSATELQPRGFALRSQVAAILMRLCEKIAAAGDAAAEQPTEDTKQDDTAPGGESSGRDETGAGGTSEIDTPAVSGFTLWADAVKASAGERDVTVRVCVNENPGILGMRLRVSYDESVMTLEDASNGDAVSGVLTLTTAKTFYSGCSFVWDGVELDERDISDGAVLLLHFRISDSAPAGRYPVSITCNKNDIVDNDLQTLYPSIQNGFVLINQ